MLITNKSIYLIYILTSFLFFHCSSPSPGINDNTEESEDNNFIAEKPTEHPWPMFQHDAQHTGRSPYKARRLRKVKWKVQIGAHFSAPVIDKECNIYLGSRLGGLYAVTYEGTIKWKFDTPDQVNSTPAIDKQGNIYFACMDKYFYSVDNNGNLRWKHLTNKAMDRVNPIIGDDGMIYLLADSAYAFNPDGTIKWTLQEELRDKDLATPAIDHRGYIYLDLDDYNLTIVNPDTSFREIIPDVGYSGISSPSIDKNNFVCYYSVSRRFLYSINIHARSLIKRPFRHLVLSTPAISEEGNIYITRDFYLQEMYFDLGSKWNWYWPIPDEKTNVSPILDSEGFIYITKGKRIYALYPEHDPIILFDNTHYLVSSPVLGHDGTLYVTGGPGGYLYAVE